MRFSRMLDVVLSNRFKKDLKLAAKRGLDLDALNAIVDQLAAGQPLPDKNRDHALTGDSIGFRELASRLSCRWGRLDPLSFPHRQPHRSIRLNRQQAVPGLSAFCHFIKSKERSYGS